MLGPAVSMERPTLAKEERKAASLEATRKQGTAGNGAVKASAPEEIPVHGRHLILRRREEAVPGVLTQTLAIPIDEGNLEDEVGRETGGSHKSGGRTEDKNVASLQMATRTDPPATPT